MGSFELMVDSLELFREICNLQWFVTTALRDHMFAIDVPMDRIAKDMFIETV